MERVCVTGIGLITALGLDCATSWKGLRAGRSGVGPITLFDPQGLDTRIAAELPAGFEQEATRRLKKRLYTQTTRVARMALLSAEEAVADSGIDFNDLDPSRCAVITGIVHNGRLENEMKPKHRILKAMPNAIPAWIGLKYGIQGPCYSISTACSSSAFAVGQGYDLIRSGNADVVLIGGADSTVNRWEIEGFNALYALSVHNDAPEKASRPFSEDRDGFVIGEGAGMLVLESERSARKRGARVYAEILGHALTSEAYNIMAPQKEGIGMAVTISTALERARVEADRVDYINAHGTSTILNDRFETQAVKRVFGNRAYEIPLSSTKSMTGHTIGAAGAIETAITALSVSTGMLPPTINYDTPEADLDLDYVPNCARDLGPGSVRIALSHSFAFGGHNAVVVVGAY